MAMESQAEALGQLTSDDLEGKVALLLFLILSKSLLNLMQLYCSLMLRGKKSSNQSQDWQISSTLIFFFFILLQFALLEGSSVDDDLASLKKELSGSSKV